MSNDREDANDMREEIVAKGRWVDTNDCDKSFHEFVCQSVIHSDGSTCDSTEWGESGDYAATLNK